MQTADRTKIIAGPALIKRGDLWMWSVGDVALTLNSTSFTLPVNGETWDERDDDASASIRFTPLGVFSTAMIAELYPLASAQPGDPLFPLIDKNIIIWGRDGKKYTFAAAAVTTMPPLKLATNAQLYGEVDYTAIRKNATAASVIDSFYKPETEAMPNVTAPLRSDVITMPYTFSLAGAAAPWDDITMKDGGVDVSFEVTAEDYLTDVGALTQRLISSVRATVSFTPSGVTADDILALFKVQGVGAVRGRSRYNDARDFVATGGSGNPRFVLKNALPVESGNVIWGATTGRAGQVQLRSVRNLANTGSWDPAFTFGIEPTE